jgi:L-cysteine:1D-myo-inositol 2-amino-2-deoxy-alpha-D-glucopyranoside ligase
VIAWDAPDLPTLPGSAPAPTVYDSRRGAVQLTPGPTARLYVCGITPYDATHLGHAATYLTFDVLNRLLRDAGHEVTYVQNVTDVDDPLLERAARDGVEWRALAQRETQLFRDDMTALRVLPPDHYVGVVESVDLIEARVAELFARGAAYQLPLPDGEEAGEGARGDVYLDLSARPDFGAVSGWDEAAMDAVFAERGGDPDRTDKRGRFDPLLWRAARPGEPSWPSQLLGAGRPGWHIECTAIALEYLGMGFDVQGGGTDLIFPHHEMSAVQAAALVDEPGDGAAEPFATAYVHQAMVGYEGHKMSKSRGNLVLVSRLRAEGEDPMAVRLALLAHRHGADWEWTDEELVAARERLAAWRAAVARPAGPAAGPVLDDVRRALADDLDTPTALTLLDGWAASALTGAGDDASAPALIRATADALLGIAL